MAILILQDGTHTEVDDDILERFSQYKWYRAGYKRRYVGTNKTYFGESNGCVFIHTLIMDTPPGMEVHHKDGNPFNNKRDNLVIVTPAVNSRLSGPRIPGKFKGVSRRKDNHKWVAMIRIGAKQKNLGCFGFSDDAARAYDKAAVELFGKDCYLNFPQDYATTEPIPNQSIKQEDRVD